MKRFFGMMPVSEIGREEWRYTEKSQTVLIQAGEHGWNIVWDDGSSSYEDVDASVDDNFNAALSAAETVVGKLYDAMEELIKINEKAN